MTFQPANPYVKSQKIPASSPRKMSCALRCRQQQRLSEYGRRFILNEEETNRKSPKAVFYYFRHLNSRHRFLPKPRLVISDIALCLQCVLSRSRVWIPNRTEAGTWICGLVLRDSQNKNFQAWGETKAGTISLQLESFNCKQATTSKTPNSKMQPVLLLHSSNPYYWRYAGMKLKVKSRGSNLLGCL